MKVFRGLEAPDIATPTVLTLGVFDGLHLGHQKIIETVVTRAEDLQAAATVLTFEPHPRAVLHPETAPPLLRTLEQKLEGLEYLGIDQVIILPFDKALAAITGHDFITNFIHHRLQAREVYLGRGFAFGYQRGGNIDLLKELSGQLGFYAAEVPEVRLRQHRISSTMVRRLLRAGRINIARRMLGRPYGIQGRVIAGQQVGRKLTVPTANLAVENAVIPADGVYITLTLVEGIWRRSLTNIGFRPTFDDEPVRSIESHLLDYSGDLYGQMVRLRFLHRLRGEKKFPDATALRAQIAHDFARAQRYFNCAAVRRNLKFE